MFEIAKVSEVYQDYNVQIAEAKKINEQTVFNYEDPKDNKAARSHIYKLRQSKASIEKARKAAKAESLAYGRAVDAEGNRLIAEIESMIIVHEEPIKAIELREEQRKQKIQGMIEQIKNAGSECTTSDELQAIYDRLIAATIGENYAEFKAQALEAKEMRIRELTLLIGQFKAQEDQQAELEKLRKEKEERERIEYEAEIARKATAEAEARAKAEAEKAEQAKLEAIRAAEAERASAEARAIEAERQRIAAEERAKVEQEQAIERAKAEERKRQEDEAAKAKKELEEREANRRHVGSIRKEAKESLMAVGLTEELAKAVVLAINDGKIANVSIRY